MKPSEILKPGMVGVELKRGFSLTDTGITVLEGDTQAKHVWLVLPNGKIATTGAEKFFFYGEVEPDDYLPGKTFLLLETVDPLTSDQLEAIQVAHNELMASGLGRFYGIWKFPWLLGIEAATGFISKSGRQVATKKPICPICSQAVAYPLWKAGVPVGESQGKEDFSAVLPKTFQIEAVETAFSEARGWLNPREKPCYLLRTVKDTPYQF